MTWDLDDRVLLRRRAEQWMETGVGNEKDNPIGVHVEPFVRKY